MRHDSHTPCVMNNTDSFYVKICGCGVVHVCFGSTTINLSPEACIAVTETLKEVTSEIMIKKKFESQKIEAQTSSLNKGRLLNLVLSEKN